MIYSYLALKSRDLLDIGVWLKGKGGLKLNCVISTFFLQKYKKYRSEKSGRFSGGVFYFYTLLSFITPIIFQFFYVPSTF